MKVWPRSPHVVHFPLCNINCVIFLLLGDIIVILSEWSCIYNVYSSVRRQTGSFELDKIFNFYSRIRIEKKFALNFLP
jgi:hypothetical protein